MKLESIEALEFGSLRHCTLADLSSGMTVFWGPNGCGKSTMVDLLNAVLFGYENSTHRPKSGRRQSGVVRFRRGRDIFRVSREIDAAGTERFSVVDQASGERAPGGLRFLPEWATPAVFRQVLTVGYDEADQFDLLVQMCLEHTGSLRTEQRRQLERAISRCTAEKDGSGDAPGITARMQTLRRERSRLLDELDRRRQVPDESARVERTRSEISVLKLEIAEIDRHLAKIQEQIEHNQSALAELQRRNTLPLERAEIQQQISDVQSRVRRWSEIRDAIGREVAALAEDTTARHQPYESLVSLRALVSRLEDRITALDAGARAAGRDPRDRDAAVSGHLRQEVAALCHYLQRHERAVESSECGVEHLMASSALESAEHTLRLLRERIAAFSEELHRADDVLQGTASGTQSHRCRHRLHSNASPRMSGGTDHRTVVELETAILSLEQERTQLVARRGQHEESLHSRKAILERLLREAGEATSLEQLDAIRAGIAGCDADLERLQARFHTLSQVEADLRQTLGHLQDSVDTGLLERASAWVRRLTESDCRSIVADASRDHLIVHTARESSGLRISELSRGTRHQVALSLRLALVEILSADGAPVPLILDDVFITSDDERAEEAVRLLMEFAADGQQILFMTCQNDVKSLFQRFGAEVREFGTGRILRDETVEPEPVADVVPEPERIEPEPEVVAELPEVRAPQPVVPLPTVPQLTPATGANWLFYLETDHPVDNLFGLQPLESQALRKADINSVLELVGSPIGELDTRIRHGGFLLQRERLLEIRQQAELSCRVPMLRPADAALLVAAGCQTTEQMAAMRPEAIYQAVVTWQHSEAGRDSEFGSVVIDQQQAINWSRSSQYARTWQAATSSRSRFSIRSNGRVRAIRRQPEDSRAVFERRREGGSKPESRRRPLPQRTSRQRRAIRNARMRRSASEYSSRRSERTSGSRTGSARHPSSSETALRFYLSRSSPVQDAPSIGPRTAERLSDAGVETVADLLNQPAERIAERLQNRRLTATVIRQWQAQSRLMCQVPEMRGHDVQILVACDITTPEDMLHYSPDELLEVVEPFVNSREGARIVRGGNPPDLDEVADWISYARCSRSVRAA